jgi:amidase
MVPVAHANDGGGSIRIPAACCGLVGLKAQRGRVSVAPEVGGSFLVVDGVLTRTVSETAQLLDILAGPELGDAWWAPEPEQPFADAAAVQPGRLRIAVTAKSPIATPVDARCAQAVEDAADLLRSLGHEVVEAEPPWGDPSLLQTFTAVFGPAVCTQIAFGGLLLGREPTPEDMEPLSWELFQLCKTIDSTSAALAELQMQAVGRTAITWAAQFDAVLTPALGEAPVPLGEIDPLSATPLEDFKRSGAFTPFTALNNVSGAPAISLPLFERPADDAAPGLPLAVQLIGQPAGEGELLALAAQLEAANPWADRRPPVS